MKCLQIFLDVSSEQIVVFRGSIKYESDVHFLRFSLRGAIDIPFFESCVTKECSSVIPSYSKRVFGGVCGSKRVYLE